MNAQDSTVANTDLWSRYLRDQWGGRQSPTAEIADGTAARVAGLFTLVAAGPIAWLYNTRRDPVVEFVPDMIESIEPAAPASLEDPAA